MERNHTIHIELNAESGGIPLYQQLAEGMKQQIRAGVLRPGEALPGSREMAEMLGVSRKTIVKAMEILVFSGWLLNRDRVGLFVTGVPNTKSHHQVAVSKMQTESKMDVADEDDLQLDINDGLPDAGLIPVDDIKQSMHRVLCGGGHWLDNAYGSPQGLREWREHISDLLNEECGLSLSASEICITRGSLMALYLIAHAVLRPGDTLVMENPGHGRAYDTFREAGINVVPINIDNDGIRVHDIEDLLETTSVKAVYVTPRYQYPTTVTLSPLRRRQLAALAIEYNLLVIEDGSFSHFQFSGQHLLPLSCQIPREHYLYVDTFSKVLGPSIRVGYVATSYELAEKMAAYRSMIDLQGDTFIEQTMLELSVKGGVRKHVRRASRVYRERLAYISDRIQERLAGRVVYHNPHGGLAIWIGFATTSEAVKKLKIEEVKSKLLSHGVRVAVFQLPSGQVGIRVGYAAMKNEQMDFLIDVLAKIV